MMREAAPRTHYRNPPIAEAICEFEFPDKRVWDVTLPGRMYDEMHTIYPLQPQVLKPEKSTSGDHGHGPKAILSTTDAQWQVHCGDSALCIHVFDRYPGWETFFDRIHHALRTY